MIIMTGEPTHTTSEVATRAPAISTITSLTLTIYLNLVARKKLVVTIKRNGGDYLKYNSPIDSLSKMDCGLLRW